MLNLAATAAARPWSLAANGGARKKMSRFYIHFIVSFFLRLTCLAEFCLKPEVEFELCAVRLGKAR